MAPNSGGSTTADSAPHNAARGLGEETLISMRLEEALERR